MFFLPVIDAMHVFDQKCIFFPIDHDYEYR